MFYEVMERNEIIFTSEPFKENVKVNVESTAMILYLRSSGKIFKK